MRSINRIFQKVESMPLDSKDYTRELGGLIGNVFRNARKEKSEANMRPYNRCLKLMDKIPSNETSYPEYVRIVCSSFSDMLVVNPENRKFALQKLEELRPVWKDTYYAKDIEYEIKKALREEGKQDK